MRSLTPVCQRFLFKTTNRVARRTFVNKHFHRPILQSAWQSYVRTSSSAKTDAELHLWDIFA